MMRYMTRIFLALFLVTLFTWPLAAAVKEDEWFNERLSADERNDLVDRSKNEPFEMIAPIVLKALVKYRPFYGMNPRGKTPWNDHAKNPRDAIYLMAEAVWQHHMRPRDDASKAKVVLSLLARSSNDSEKLFLIAAMKNYLWFPDDESALRDLCLDGQQPLEVRTRSAEALLHRGDLNLHLPLAMEIIMAHKPGLDRCQAFSNTTNLGNRLSTLNEKNKQALVDTGFTILEELPEKDLQTGYFVARELGHFLKTPNAFAPDETAEQYRGPNGLLPEFFIDTVKKAIAWHAQHKEGAKER